MSRVWAANGQQQKRIVELYIVNEEDIREIKESVAKIQGDVRALCVGLARVEEHVEMLPDIKNELLGHQRRLSRLEGIGTFAGLIVATVLTWLGIKR